jgi:glycosyltransferase involved in cell wall biosynthesis
MPTEGIRLNALTRNSTPKHILVLTSTFPRWNNDVEPPFVHELCRRLSKTFSVHVLAPHASGAAVEDQMEGIHVTRYRYFFSRWENLAFHGGILANLKQNPLRYALVPFFVIAQLIVLIRLLNRHQIDCIHAHWLIPQGLIAITACLFIKSAPPVIVTSHGGDLFGLKGYVFNRLKRFVALRSAAVTVVSHAMSEVLQELRVNDSRINVIPMGVDLRNRFVPAVQRSEKGALLFVGRLVEKKGLKYLIEALPLILEKHPNVTLKIVGDGQEKERIIDRILELDIGGQVEFLGAVANQTLTEIYQSSDVVVFPSIVADDGDREGLGLVLVEALGCACATVVTDLPAMQDIIQNGISALVVPQKDARSLAEKINLLIDDDSLRQSLGKRGRQYVLKKFDWEIITNQYKELIRSVIK